ncbi:MAG: type III secretion system chaperone [Rhodospirillales bacterium]|nr:type III secretion system chaperone [Rhodospirillales bacterium]
MPNAHTRFADYIGACCKTLELPPPNVDGDNYIFKVGDRWVELKRNDRGDRLTFVSLVYMAPPETAMRADLIASFNLHYLFNGGFTLITDAEQSRLYLCRPHRLDALDARHIREELRAFAEAAAMAGTWYIRTSEEPLTPPPAGDTGIFLKV